jgi:hypothetical protein
VPQFLLFPFQVRSEIRELKTTYASQNIQHLHQLCLLMNTTLYLLLLAINVHLAIGCSCTPPITADSCLLFKSTTNLLRGTAVSTYAHYSNGTLIQKFNSAAPESDVIKYTFEVAIAQVYRTNTGLDAGQNVNISSDGAIGMCGRFLPENVEYLVDVENGSVSNCGLSTKWDDLSQERIEALTENCEDSFGKQSIRVGLLFVVVVALVLL